MRSAAEPASSGARTVVKAQLSAQGAEAWRLAFRIVLAALAVGIGLWLAVTLRQILLQILVAIILASGLLPLVERLKAWGVPRGLAVVLIYLVLISCLVALGFALVPPVVNQIEEAISSAPELGDRSAEALRSIQVQFPFLAPLDEQVIGFTRTLGSQIGALASQVLVVARFALSFFSGLLSAVLVLLLTLYLIVDGYRVREYVLSFVPSPQRPRFREVTDRMGIRMGGWLVGQITLVLVVGTVSYVGLTILGVPGALLLAVVAGIGEAIPIVGPIASAIPAILVAATHSPLQAGLTALLYLMIQQLENNFLVPKIMERAVNLHPLAVVLSLLAGSELLGVIGAIVAVPVAAAVSVVLDEVRRPTVLASENPPSAGVVPPAPRAASATARTGS